MDKALDTLCYIQEQTSFEEDYNGKFGYTVTDLGSRFYVTFPSILQSFRKRNRNGREYDLDNIWRCIQTDEYIKHCLATNQWQGEEDHPEAEKVGQELNLQRIGKVKQNNTSHYIRSPRRNDANGLLEANIQTDSATDAGMRTAIKIVDGKIVPCFSARVLGSKAPGSNKVMVRRLITYDLVTFPSHADAMAKINQPLMESVNEMEQYVNSRIIYLPELAKSVAGKADEVKMLCEAFELTEDDIIGVTETGNSVVLAENNNVYVQPITESQLRERTKSSLTDWLNS